MNIDINNSERAKTAMALFKEGYSCSQAVFMTFSDLHGLDKSVAAKLAAPFGGGMGRMREVCGAVSGMFMTEGMLHGYDSPNAPEEKKEHYRHIQEMAGAFSAETGSIVCKELLGLTEKKQDPTPEKRTEEYYKKRPCVELVGLAAAIMEERLKEEAAKETL